MSFDIFICGVCTVDTYENQTRIQYADSVRHSLEIYLKSFLSFSQYQCANRKL